ncbi:MAG TPA: N-acetylneuraminate synthase, partial [Vicinamibacterales bacterium]|nr:N-acetylneuraminate synthase [Vicinamibacterales bacterium]
MRRELEIAGRRIGEGHPCFVIAEAGVNHNGRLDLALELVDAAAAAGADAIKFQTFSAETLVSPDAPQFPYVEGGEGATSQFEMLRRLELPRADHEPIRRRAEARGLVFLSTPFHESDADWLNSFGIPAFKIPSGEVTNLPYLRHIAAMGKPVILSTGMCTLGEVDLAIAAMGEAGARELVILHCVSDYPADPADINLRAMETLQRAFGVPVGYSDHTVGIDVALAAAALGANLIEKHLTLDRSLPGPDHRASTDPSEFGRMTHGIHAITAALGDGIKRPTPSELKTRVCVRKSLVAARDIAAGETLSEDVVAVRRPGDGLAPDMLAL